MSHDVYGLNGDRTGAESSRKGCPARHAESQVDPFQNDRIPQAHHQQHHHHPCPNREVRGRTSDGTQVIIQHADRVYIQGNSFPDNDYRSGGPDFRRVDPNYARTFGPSPWEMQQMRDQQVLQQERSFYMQRLAMLEGQRAYQQSMAWNQYSNYQSGAMTPAGWDGYGGQPRLAIRANLGHGVFGEIAMPLGGNSGYRPYQSVGYSPSWDSGYQPPYAGWDNGSSWDGGFRPNDPRYRSRDYAYTPDFNPGYRPGYRPGYMPHSAYANLSVPLGHSGAYLNIGTALNRLFG